VKTTRHIIPVSGKDSLATAIVQAARRPDLEYEYIYNDTRAELPDTYAWLDKVESTMGIKISRVGKNLETIIYEQEVLPSPRMRYCTKYAKIYPMHDYIGKDEAVLYIGIRADEDRAGKEEKKNIAVSYPLKEMGINLALVYRIVGDKGLLPPTFFWKRLHDAVRAQLGPDAFVVDELAQWVFDRAFAWRSRPNCYFCFYQRRYEWIGLLEHYPALFDRAEKIEAEVGESDNREHPYFWISEELPLSRMRERAEDIFQTRVDALCKLLRKRLQKELFDETLIDALDMAGTSCGLYCGK
jgi:phosphoadenosine phosphosulfate reductase family protein